MNNVNIKRVKNPQVAYRYGETSIRESDLFENTPETKTDMRTITIHCYSKNSNGVYSESIRVDNVSKEAIKKVRDEIFVNAKNSLGKYYYEVECFDKLTEEESIILSDLDLESTF